MQKRYDATLKGLLERSPEAWPMLTKREVADRLLDRIAAILDARDEAADGESAQNLEMIEESVT